MWYRSVFLEGYLDIEIVSYVAVYHSHLTRSHYFTIIFYFKVGLSSVTLVKFGYFLKQSIIVHSIRSEENL